MTLNFIPRPSQEQILRYRGGRLGIAAVPGAGKTQILSALAAQIIAGGALADDQEVLIVTLVNSAVDNFESRVKRFFDNPLQALYRYRVRTLHGLSHDIVREKSGRVGLDERFGIIDEREADFIRREAVKSWMSVHAETLDEYLDPTMEEHKRDWVRRDQLPDMISNLALAFIRSSKDRRLTPEKLRALLDRQPASLPLAELGLEIYADGLALAVTETGLVVRDADGPRTVDSDPESARIAVDRAFIDAVRGDGDDIRVPYAEALRTHAVALAVAEAAATGRAVTPRTAEVSHA